MDLDLKAFYWQRKNENRLCLSGKDKCRRWIKQIGSANPKHLNKFLKWLELKGFQNKIIHAEVALSKIKEKNIFGNATRRSLNYISFTPRSHSLVR